MMISSSLAPAITPTGEWSLYVDGATFGSNPSELGAGAFTVWRGGELHYAACHPLHSATNNRAEAFALTRALSWLDYHGMQETPVYTDSDIMTKWCNGKAKLSNPHLLSLAAKLTTLMSYTRPKVEWVPRNTRELAFTDYVASYGVSGKRLVFDTFKSHAPLIAGYYSL